MKKPKEFIAADKIYTELFLNIMNWGKDYSDAKVTKDLKDEAKLVLTRVTKELRDESKLILMIIPAVTVGKLLYVIALLYIKFYRA